jgi:hypothetical protein
MLIRLDNGLLINSDTIQMVFRDGNALILKTGNSRFVVDQPARIAKVLRQLSWNSAPEAGVSRGEYFSADGDGFDNLINF